MQVVAELHEVLDVKHAGEVQVEQLKELRLCCGQRLARQHLLQHSSSSRFSEVCGTIGMSSVC